MPEDLQIPSQSQATPSVPRPIEAQVQILLRLRQLRQEVLHQLWQKPAHVDAHWNPTVDLRFCRLRQVVLSEPGSQQAPAPARWQ